MKITAYKITDNPLHLVKAEPTRKWMDETFNRFSYRCLPLTIANSYGWELKSNCEFIATYTGGKDREAIQVKPISGTNFPESHFGDSILTWHVGYLFKTEYPYGLYIQGPVNDGCAHVTPLSGIVETHWLPFTFTMNWRFMAPGELYVNHGDTICHIFPIDLTIFEKIETEVVNIEDAPQVNEEYKTWSKSRDEFNKNINRTSKDWQKFYFKGNYPDKIGNIENHITRIQVPDFIKTEQ